MPPSHHLQQCHKLQLLTFSLRNHFRRKRMEANVCHEKKKRIYKICHTSLTFFPHKSEFISHNLNSIWRIYMKLQFWELCQNCEIISSLQITFFIYLFFPWQKHINIIFISKTFCFRKNCVFCLRHRIKISNCDFIYHNFDLYSYNSEKSQKKLNFYLTIIYFRIASL